MKNIKIAYFGGEPLGVPTLNELEQCGFLPSLIVCNPDRPAGRGRQLTAPPVKEWAHARDIAVWQPTDFKDKDSIAERLRDYDLFIVVAYNHILPEWLIELPQHKTLNVHPSLLPKLRGASPIRTVILEDRRDQIGVSIMLMDAKMDHGPLIAQQSVPIADQGWPVRGLELDDALASLGGALLAATIPSWTSGSIKPEAQNHDEATYCHKHTKDMGELAIDPGNLPTGVEAAAALRKIRAFDGFPGTFFFHNKKRVKITDAELAPDGSLQILRVIPEGKREIDWQSFTDQIASSS